MRQIPSVRALCGYPLAVCAAGLMSTACGDEDVVIVGTPMGQAEQELGAAYALAVAVWSDSGATGYISVSDRLDRGDLDLSDALEVPGYPSIQTANGQLLIANDEALSISRFDVTGGLDLVPRETLSFVGQGVAAVLFGNQYWQGNQTAYNELEVTQRVLWDPVSFEIQGLLPASALPLERDGLQLFSAFNRTTFVAKDEVVMPFTYHDQDWVNWSPSSQLAIYDADTHALRNVIEAPCPALDSITEDESGYKYLSTWEYSTLFSLMGTGAAPCVTRLNPDNSLDTTWNPDLTSLTGGRPIKNFRYLGGGKAIAGVLDTEEYGEGFDFSRFLETTDDFWSTEGRYHRLWMFDLEARSATPVTGIEFEFVQPSFSHAVIDGRFFVAMADGSSNQAPRAIVYELDAEARATRMFEVAGEALQWVKIR